MFYKSYKDSETKKGNQIWLPFVMYRERKIIETYLSHVEKILFLNRLV